MIVEGPSGWLTSLTFLSAFSEVLLFLRGVDVGFCVGIRCGFSVAKVRLCKVVVQEGIIPICTNFSKMRYPVQL